MPRFGPPLLLCLALLAFLLLRGENGPPRLAPAAALSGVAEGSGVSAAPAPSPALAVPEFIPPTAAPAVAAAPAFAPAPPGPAPYIPILMYHYVRYVDQAADPLGYGLSVTPEQLAAQLAWLKGAGYDSVGMGTVSACVRGQGTCPARGVALTFDDGYSDAYSAALPLLQQQGFTATFYIVSGFVGHDGYMGWDEIRALHAAGMEIGAHSISHLDLTTLSHDEDVDQIARSGVEIAAQIGAPVSSFCYPAGRYNPEIAAIARDVGYANATTTANDLPESDPYALPRLRIPGDMSLEGFQSTIRAYLP
jgi:peptidoglycan/xylan/chitin deacetylase (PgdA/CDA1 family)